MTEDVYVNREELNFASMCKDFLSSGFLKQAAADEVAREEAQRQKEINKFGASGRITGMDSPARDSSKQVSAELSALLIDTSGNDAVTPSKQRMKIKSIRSRTEKSTQRARAMGGGNLSIVQLCTWYTQTVAASLHDIWRSNRLLHDGSFKPRVKLICGHQYDIANLNYGNLPARFKYENMQAAMVACNDVFSAIISGKPIDDRFLLKASINQHKEWLRRNGEWAPPSQKVPFHKLTPEDKEKDTVIVQKAMVPFV